MVYTVDIVRKEFRVEEGGVGVGVRKLYSNSRYKVGGGTFQDPFFGLNHLILYCRKYSRERRILYCELFNLKYDSIFPVTNIYFTDGDRNYIIEHIPNEQLSEAERQTGMEKFEMRVRSPSTYQHSVL